MNITDVEFIRPEGDMLILIFEKQKELMDKYHHIEESQGVGYGILQGRKFNIDEIRSQCLCKDFAWRITEELGEAAEDPNNMDHFLEELADSLHFYTELLITVGITPDDICSTRTMDKLEAIYEPWGTHAMVEENFYGSAFLQVILPLSQAMNCLKQKPWKQTHILTDTSRFKKFLTRGYLGLLYLMFEQDLTPLEVYSYYFKKQKVNKFRQDSNY